MLKLKKRNGFTLIELLVVLVLIGILAGAAILINYPQQLRKAHDSVRRADMEKIRSALEMYRADRADGCYPETALLVFNGTTTLSYSGRTYLDPIPPDPSGHNFYHYDRPACRNFVLWTDLETGGIYQVTPEGSNVISASPTPTPSPTPPCWSGNCGSLRCCSGSTCVTGTLPAFCGTNGQACLACTTGKICPAGVCISPTPTPTPTPTSTPTPTPTPTSTPTPTPTPTTLPGYQWTRCTNYSSSCQLYCQSQGHPCANVCNGSYGLGETEVGYPWQYGTCAQTTSPLGGAYTGYPLSSLCSNYFNVYCCCGSTVISTPTPTPTSVPSCSPVGGGCKYSTDCCCYLDGTGGFCNNGKCVCLAS